MNDALLKVAISAVDQEQIQFVNLHRLSVYVVFIVPRMTRWAEPNQVLKLMILAF
jgi:hypothetical protein